MVNRETITVNVATIEQCDVTGSLSVFIEDMKSYLDGVPQEYRAAVEIEMERGDPEWGDPAQLVISYERPETDSEYQKRAGDIKAAQASRIRETEAHERHVLALLKKKYEQ